MKLYYYQLQIELTRRCNQKCVHCCKDEPQNVDINKEIIDDFFAKNDIYYIDTLLFSGGEPALNGEMLEYFVDKLIEKEIIVYSFTLSINGLSYDEALIRGLNKLRDYIILKSEKPRYCPGILIVTQDQFHKDADKEVVEKLKRLPYFSPIQRYELSEEDILPYGRALTNGLSKQQPDLSRLIDYQKSFRVVERDGYTYLVIDYQYISANGNVVNDGCESYDLMDKYALGNVRDQSIEEIYINGPSKKLINNVKKV